MTLLKDYPACAEVMGRLTNPRAYDFLKEQRLSYLTLNAEGVIVFEGPRTSCVVDWPWSVCSAQEAQEVLETYDLWPPATHVRKFWDWKTAKYVNQFADIRCIAQWASLGKSRILRCEAICEPVRKEGLFYWFHEGNGKYDFATTPRSTECAVHLDPMGINSYFLDRDTLLGVMSRRIKLV